MKTTCNYCDNDISNDAGCSLTSCTDCCVKRENCDAHNENQWTCEGCKEPNSKVYMKAYTDYYAETIDGKTVFTWCGKDSEGGGFYCFECHGEVYPDEVHT